MKVKVAITERFHPHALQLLQTDPNISIVSNGSLPKQQDLKEVDGFITRSKTKIDLNFLSHASNTKWIISTTSGFDHIDLTETKKRSIKVMYTPEAHAAGVAELTVGLLVGAARKFSAAPSSLIGDAWRSLGPGRELRGSTLGIVGLGRIGQRVARIAQALEVNILAHDPYQSDEAFQQGAIKRVSFDELIRLSDILSFHVPLTPFTRHMFTMDCLEVIPEGQILINTSRGEVIEEKVLVKGLTEGTLGAVGLDVFAVEPQKLNSQLLKLPGVLATPHIGAFTEEAFLKASLEGAQKALDFIHKGAVSDSLPPEADWYRSEFAKS